MSNNAQTKSIQLGNIKLAIMSLNWNNPGGEYFIPWLKEVQDAGYEGITMFADQILEEFGSEPADLEKILADHELSLTALNGKLHTSYDDYRKVFEFMQRLHCKHFVCIDPAGTEKDYAKYGKVLNQIGEISLEYNILTHYHNHTDAVGETFSDMEKLMAELDFSKVFLMLDVGHATKDFEEFPYSERAIHFLNKYWERIHYLEFKDWNEKSELNTPIGEGYADFEQIFSLIRERGYSGWITVEQNGNDGLSLGRSPQACAKISRNFIKKNLGI